MSGGFSIFDHTADIGLNVWADTCVELFEYSASGMCSLIVNKNTINTQKRVKIILSSSSLEELLFQWLKEILFQTNATGMVFSSFQIQQDEFSHNKQNNYNILAYLYGEQLDIERHEVCDEIKAVTRHKFKVDRGKQDWKATIIFDV